MLFAVAAGRPVCVFLLRCWAPQPVGGAGAKKQHDPGCVLFWLRPVGLHNLSAGPQQLETVRAPQRLSLTQCGPGPRRFPGRWCGFLAPTPPHPASQEQKLSGLQRRV